jgi:hypothetical protein
VAFKQEHGKKAELPCPDAKQGEKNCPLRTKGYLSTQTWIMDREFGGWLPVGIKSLSITRLWYDKPVRWGERRRCWRQMFGTHAHKKRVTVHKT